jgi:hypothetical protein
MGGSALRLKDPEKKNSHVLTALTASGIEFTGSGPSSMGSNPSSPFLSVLLSKILTFGEPLFLHLQNGDSRAQ